MEFKVFGKSLFEIKKGDGANHLYMKATNEVRKIKYLPDFSKAGRNEWDGLISFSTLNNVGEVIGAVPKTEVKDEKPKEEPITPKGAFNLKLLNDETFELKTDPEYVESQLVDFKIKLELISSEEYDMRRGVEEIGSIVMRLENRKKYTEHAEFFDQFPYTLTSRINDVVKKHSNLQLGQIAQFIADMPKEAVKVMKEYNKACDDLCGKQAVFYIIADKKDFKKTDSRRDPILLAQSPFAHAWQILGARDDEMLFVEEL